MCGIAGIINFPDNKRNGIGEKMKARLFHRGPDDNGSYSDKEFAFAHTRLSILDLSPLGHQPMSTPDGKFTITFNGEIYNYRIIREGLEHKGYTFKSDSDTEVLLCAWQEWGVKSLEKLNGMFAFAIYDHEKDNTFLVRDRLGIKPLYYAEPEKGRWLFASEVRSLLASGQITPKLNLKALPAYLKYQSVPPPQTLVKGISLLEPGHYLKIQNGQAEKKAFWDVRKSFQAPQNSSKPETQVKELLTAAIKRRMISDVPLGAFLSGGIDSSLIVGVMSEINAEPIKTFTVAFDDPAFEDGRYAQKVAKRFNTDHTEVSMQVDDVLHQLPQALISQDHPSSDGMNTWIVSKAAKESDLTVVLSGLGGDELFAGYAGFARIKRQQSWRKLWDWSPQSFRKKVATIIKSSSSISKQKMGQLMASDGSLAEVFPINRQFYSDQQIRDLLSGDCWADPYQAFLKEHLPNFSNSQVISATSFAELKTYMHDVLLRDTDQMSMAHALEVRVPFLDHTLVEYVMSLKDEQKFNPAKQKSLLVDAFADLLPDEILNRPKQGFIMPFDKWMKGPLKGFCEAQLKNLAKIPTLNQEQLWKNWEMFQNGSTSISWSRLWLLVALGHWMFQNKIEA